MFLVVVLMFGGLWLAGDGSEVLRIRPRLRELEGIHLYPDFSKVLPFSVHRVSFITLF